MSENYDTVVSNIALKLDMLSKHRLLIEWIQKDIINYFHF